MIIVMTSPDGATKVLNDEALPWIWLIDSWLDAHAGAAYQEQPLAQDWGRVAKLQEEAGEAIDALIGFTGQNPRKGVFGSEDDLLSELADCAMTAIFAIQHFTKDAPRTARVLDANLAKAIKRAA